MGVALSPELQEIIKHHPPAPPVDRLWDEAIEQSYSLPIPRAGGIHETPAERIVRLRDQLKGELVAFHNQLHVEPYAGAELACAGGRRMWTIRVPLTLFPKRDQGFSRLECIVELRSEGAPQSFRVVKLLPEPRTEVIGKVEFGAKLDVETSAKLGAKLALPGVLTLVGDVATELYGKAQADFTHELRRECVVSEIVDGTGARWRLDDVSHPEHVTVEGHQLALIVEAGPAAARLHATGLVQAYSDVRWLTSSLGSLWQSLKGRVLEFFRRGAPVEAYGEWRDILSAGPG
ncbi:MAG TPA: hypothetical protein VHT91_41720 [Kofleriaceae bacterium]|nr:hypothetical protein [Kofleriaceae bacterium]